MPLIRRGFSPSEDSAVNNTLRTIMVWLVIGVILTMVFMQVGNRHVEPEHRSTTRPSWKRPARAASPR